VDRKVLGERSDPHALGGAPAVSGSRDGDVYVAWQDSDQPGAPYDVFCSRLGRGTWSLPEDVSDSPGQQSLAPGIACDNLGSIHVVWEERVSGRYSVRLSWGSAGAWSIPETLSGQAAPGLSSQRDGGWRLQCLRGLG